MHQLFTWLTLIRAVNCLMAAAAVWVGACLTDYSFSWRLGLAMFGAFAVCAAGNIVNDIRDVSTDRISHPKRPLPSGTISIRTATRLAWALHIVSLVAAALVNLWVLGVAIVLTSLLLAYNFRLKRVPLAGNVTVAVLSGLPFLCGGLTVDPAATFALPGPWPAVVFAFFMHLAREIVKDVEDVSGDSAAGILTFPQVAGAGEALGLAFLLFLILAYLTLLPLWWDWYGLYYLFITVLLIDFPLLIILFYAWLRPSATSVRWSRATLKWGMVLGLVALVLA